MTAKEIELLEIAKEIIDLNQAIKAKLTGSLMLALHELPKRREAQDIDIICVHLCMDSHGSPNMPSGFRLIESEGRHNSDLHAMHYVNDQGVKVDFMSAYENFTEIVHGVRCGSLEALYEAKQRYAEKDERQESREKHKYDLIIMNKI